MRKAASMDEPRDEPRWHAAIAVAVALALYATMPNRVVVGPLWLLPLLMMVILVPLLVFSPMRRNETRLQRLLSLATVVLLDAFNITTLILLLEFLISAKHHKALTGEELLLAAVQIWLVNVIVYTLWYWEIDGRGPDYRISCSAQERLDSSDFLFPQQMLNVQQRIDFRPRIWDYLFLAFNTATAFSPCDTFPVTHGAKILMMTESLISLITLAIIAGRAVNILGG